MSGLDPFRRRLDVLDDQIARLLGERFEICREVAVFKRANDIAMMQPDRVTEVRARYLARGHEAGLPVASEAETASLDGLVDACVRFFVT